MILYFILLREFFNRKTETKRKPKKSIWVEPWLQNRAYESAYGRIFTELRLHDQEEFRRYLRMNTDLFRHFFVNVYLLYFI